MPDDDKTLKKLDQELDAMVPRHIIIDPHGYTIHGYSDDEASGVLYTLAEVLHDRAVEKWEEPDEE